MQRQSGGDRCARKGGCVPFLSCRGRSAAQEMLGDGGCGGVKGKGAGEEKGKTNKRFDSADGFCWSEGPAERGGQTGCSGRWWALDRGLEGAGDAASCGLSQSRRPAE